MRTESAAPAIANMSAPPRSTVMLPRLVPGAAAPDAPTGGSSAAVAEAMRPLRSVPVGPGGGRLLSNALLVARVELVTALCAHLRMRSGAPALAAHLGLARALVAIAHSASEPRAARDPARAARRALGRAKELPEGELVQELATRLESFAWPAWVPVVAFARPLGADIAAGIDRSRPPTAPHGVACPWLAARLVAAIRGPVFLRDAPPALSNLLSLCGGDTPSRIWEIWLPVAPGRVQPLSPASLPTQEFDA